MRRLRLGLRVTALTLVLVGPTAEAYYEVHVAQPTWRSEVQPAAAAADSDATPEAAAGRYLAHRNPLVDRLLPAGAGGIHFVRELSHHDAGEAEAATSSIALCADELLKSEWPESIELHERAHLLDAFLPHETTAVLARVGQPNPAEYAARNAAEHFAEMAGKAWEVSVPPDGVCIDGSPADRLREVERRVPGTAGFVLYYLRRLPADLDGRAELAAAASQLSAPAAAEWEALWKALDARRRPDDTFVTWGGRTMHEYIEALRRQFAASGGMLDRVASLWMWPTQWALTMLDQ